MATRLEQVKPLTYAEGNGGSWLSPLAALSSEFGNGWVEIRSADSTRYRETFPAFEPDGDYIMRVKIPSLDDIPFDIPRKGRQIANPGAQRQVNAAITQIDLLPTFFKVVSVPG